MQRSILVAVRLGVAVALGAVPLVACTPQEGGACSHEGAGRCLDATRALTCRDGLWRSLACRGGAGCSATADALQCDQRAAREGESCTTFGQRACTEAGVAKPSLLACLQATSAHSTGSAWTREAACLGPAGCRLDGTNVTCDDSRSEAGELCLQAGQRACDGAGTTLLQCRNGRFAVERVCARCAVDGDAGLSCD